MGSSTGHDVLAPGSMHDGYVGGLASHEFGAKDKNCSSDMMSALPLCGVKQERDRASGIDPFSSVFNLTGILRAVDMPHTVCLDFRHFWS